MYEFLPEELERHLRHEERWRILGAMLMLVALLLLLATAGLIPAIVFSEGSRLKAQREYEATQAGQSPEEKEYLESMTDLKHTVSRITTAASYDPVVVISAITQVASSVPGIEVAAVATRLAVVEEEESPTLVEIVFTIQAASRNDLVTFVELFNVNTAESGFSVLEVPITALAAEENLSVSFTTTKPLAS